MLDDGVSGKTRVADRTDLSHVVRASASHPFFDYGQYVSRDTVYSIESKQIAVHSGRASGPFLACVRLTNVSDGGSQLRKIMTSVTHSRTLTRNAPPIRDASLPLRFNRVYSVGRSCFFFATFGPFAAARLIAASDTRGLRVCTRVHDRIALRCHDSHSPSFSAHPLHSSARERDAVMNSRILSPVLDTIIKRFVISLLFYLSCH